VRFGSVEEVSFGSDDVDQACKFVPLRRGVVTNAGSIIESSCHLTQPALQTTAQERLFSIIGDATVCRSMLGTLTVSSVSVSWGFWDGQWQWGWRLNGLAVAGKHCFSWGFAPGLIAVDTTWLNRNFQSVSE